MAVKMLSERCEATSVDAAKHDLPMLDKMYKEYAEGEAPENLERIARIFRESDEFVVLSGEYNHGMPPGLKNLLDHFQREYFFKPAGILTYSVGSFGGVRAVVHVRAVLGELGKATVSNMLPVPKVSSAIDEDGTPADDKMPKRFTRIADELLCYAAAYKPAREKGTPSDLMPIRPFISCPAFSSSLGPPLPRSVVPFEKCRRDSADGGNPAR
ncbi:MAG: NADPH-dependent FMN reductase [Cryomorphaceae bacterium]